MHNTKFDYHFLRITPGKMFYVMESGQKFFKHLQHVPKKFHLKNRMWTISFTLQRARKNFCLHLGLFTDPFVAIPGK